MEWLKAESTVCLPQFSGLFRQDGFGFAGCGHGLPQAVDVEHGKLTDSDAG
jgi:hypothetical protein